MTSSLRFCCFRNLLLPADYVDCFRTALVCINYISVNIFNNNLALLWPPPPQI